MNKCKVFLLFFLHGLPFCLLSAQRNITSDTIYVNSLFNKALLFDNKAELDSASVYYLKASELYLSLANNSKLPKNWASIKFLLTLEKLVSVKIQIRNYAQASIVADRMIEHAIKVFGENSPYSDSALGFKGLILYYLGEYDKAIEYWQRVLQIEKICYGEKSHVVFITTNYLGALYRITGKYDLALEYYFKALNISKEFLQENNPLIATSYNDIGYTYSEKGEYDLALEYHLKSLNIRKSLFGEKHPDVAISYNNIGNVYHKQGEYDLGLKYLTKAVDIFKGESGDNRLNIAMINNNIGENYSAKGEYDKALEFHFSALKVRHELLEENNIDIAKSYNNIGNVYVHKSNNDIALEYHFKALNIRKKLLGEAHPSVAISYNNIGEVYLKKGVNDSALIYFSKALIINNTILGEKHPATVTSYNNIASVYANLGNYNLTLEYLLKALSINKELYGENYLLIATSYNNIGVVYNNKGEYTQALEYCFKALKILNEAYGENHPNVAITNNNIGDVYHQRGEYDSALVYYLKALSIRKETSPELHPDLAMFYTNIGLIYSHKEQYNLALEYYLKALKIKKEFFGEKHPDVAWSYNIIGVDLNKQKKYKLALKYFQKGIVANSRSFNDSSNVYSNPILNNYFEAPALLISLYGKAQVFNRKQDYISSLRNFNLCDSLIIEMRKTASTKTDKFAWGEQTNLIYEEAINVCMSIMKNPPDNYPKKYYEEQAFKYSEKSKAGVLIVALTGKESLKFAGIPDSLLQKEHELQIDISFYEKRLAETPDSINEILFRDQLFKLNRRYDELIAKFEKEYPDYFNLKYATINITIKDIQSILDYKTAIRSYFQGDSIIYIFTLTKHNLDIQAVPKLANLNDTITRLRYGLTKTSPRMQESYRRIGLLLYRQLFPENAELDKQIKNLIIIPDGNLAILPFESLLTSNYTDDINSYKEYPYLIKKYNISYSYSANLYYRTFSREASSTIEITNLNDWLAFAPVFDKSVDNTLSMSTCELKEQLDLLKTDSLMINRSMFDRSYITPLPSTETETKTIFSLFNDNNLKAKVILYNNANEQTIKSGELEKYRVLHFATHGFVNSERPELSGLLFAQDTTAEEDGILYLGEIYNLKLNADLVVLSACETGLGQIQKGEGIIGLTRALLYAGTNNIVVSLWQVADQSTSDLMVDFYKNSLASKGMQSYSEALRNAKLKMIKEGKYAHPLYWAPFILIGH